MLVPDGEISRVEDVVESEIRRSNVDVEVCSWAATCEIARMERDEAEFVVRGGIEPILQQPDKSIDRRDVLHDLIAAERDSGHRVLLC